MRKEKSKNKPELDDSLTEGPDASGESAAGSNDENSIQDFIELKKLQNRVLGKIIENINQTENKNKSKNK
jgi:hypothetical protein